MSEQFDVVIVGGGVSGCSIAYFLASRPDLDASVTVIERDPTYEYAPSAKSTGGFRQQFSTPENIEIGLFGAHFVKHIADYLAVDGEVPDVGFREHGYLLIATEEHLELMQGNNQLQRRLGAKIEMQSPADLNQRFAWLNTERAAAGFYGTENEGWVDPYALLQAYRRKARSLGVRFVHDEVQSVSSEGHRATTVHLANGDPIAAGIVVNVAGASGVREVARSVGLELPIESRKRCTFVLNTRESIGITPLTIFPEGVAFRPEGANYIANMAPPQTQDPDTQSNEVDYNLFDEIIWPTLAAWVPAFEAVKMTGAWCCHYDFNLLDENVIIDRHPNLDNYFFATGFSGHGLQQSPAIGRAMSELIATGGYETLDLTRFGFERIASNRPLLETNCY